MTEIDAQIRRELERRAGSGQTKVETFGDRSSGQDQERLVAGIADRISDLSQIRPRPWEGLRVDKRIDPRPVAAALIAVAVVLGIAMAGGFQRAVPPGPTEAGSATPQPPASLRSTWFLSAAELGVVLARTATDKTDIGKVVVASVSLAAGETDCASPGRDGCPRIWSVIGVPGQYLINVTGLENGCSYGTPTCDLRPGVRPHALRIIGPSVVEYIATVHLRDADPAIPWSVGDFASEAAAASGMAMVVDAWLEGEQGTWFCAAQISPSIPMGCGPPAWVVPQPLETNPGPMTRESPALEPSSRLRVQDGAANLLLGAPERSRHGLYLITPIFDLRSCLRCNPLTGRVLGIVDVVSLEGATEAPTPPH